MTLPGVKAISQGNSTRASAAHASPPVVAAPVLFASKYRTRLLSWFLSSATLVFFAEDAAAQVLRNPPTPFGPLVYDDAFTDPATQTGISNGLKNIPLGSSPDWYVNFGGSLRERFEAFSNSVFGLRQARATFYIVCW
jgi:hypothetical protein